MFIFGRCTGVGQNIGMGIDCKSPVLSRLGFLCNRILI